MPAAIRSRFVIAWNGVLIIGLGLMMRRQKKALLETE